MKPKFDLDSYSETELRELNREIVRRLDIYSVVRRKSQLMAFRVGDRVAFDADHGMMEGVVTRISQKTASIEADDGRGWRVSPDFLTKIAHDSKPAAGQRNLFSIVDGKKVDQR